MLKREIQEPHAEATSKGLRRRDIAFDEDIRKLLESLEGDELLWIILLVITGRRSIDIGRLKWNHIRQFGDKFGCLIPKDKASKRTPVSFAFRWSEFDIAGYDAEAVKQLFTERVGKSSSYVIKTNSKKESKRQNELKTIKQRITRDSEFNIHALRSRRAVIELMNGKAENLVKAKIGWKSEAMVRYYTILTADQVCEFNSYNEFCKYILTQIN